MHPVAFWLLGMGLLQLGLAIVRLLVGVAPRHPEVLDNPVIATAIGVVAFAVHWAASRGLRSVRPRTRRLAGIVAGVLIVGWASMTLVALNASNFPEGEDDPPPGGIRFSPGSNTLAAQWRAVAWPRVLYHLKDLDLPLAPWPAPQILCGVAVLGIAAWMIGYLVTARPPPLLAPPVEGEANADLRRRLAAFRAQLTVSPGTLWLARVLALHLALNSILTLVALIGHANSALGHRT